MSRSITKFRKLFWALLIRGSVMGVQFAVSILVALVAGPFGSGVYGIYNAWLAIFNGVAGLGAYTHALRTVSILKESGSSSSIRHYLVRLINLVLIVSFSLGLALILFNSQIAERFLGDPELDYVILFAVISGALTILVKIGAESLKGLDRVNTALVIEWVIVPLMMLMTLSTALLSEYGLSMYMLLALRTIFLLGIAILIFEVVRHVLRASSLKGDARGSVSLSVLAPFWGSEVTIVWFMNIPYIVLPYFATTEDIGLFSVAQKLILTATSVLVVLSSIYGPKIARAYESDDLKSVSRLLRQTQGFALGLYSPVFVIFCVYPQWVMSLFGEEFVAGSPLLVYMAVGQFFAVFCGLGDFTLHMMGRERLFFKINIGTTLLLVLLCFLVGPVWGVEGVAFAFAVVIALKQLGGYLGAVSCLRSQS